MTPLAFSLEATFAEGGMPVATATARYDAFRRHGAGLVPVGAPDTGVLESLQWAYAHAAGRAGSLTHLGNAAGLARAMGLEVRWGLALAGSCPGS